MKLNQWKDDWWSDWGRRQTEEGQRKQKHRGRVGIELGGLVILLRNRDERSTLVNWEKWPGTRNTEEIKQDNTGRSFCAMVCKKYLFKENSPLKPRREPEFAVLLQLTSLSET